MYRAKQSKEASKRARNMDDAAMAIPQTSVKANGSHPILGLASASIPAIFLFLVTPCI